MTPEGFKRIAGSDKLTEAEKRYILDIWFRMGGSFCTALFEAIALADQENRTRFALGFPEEVAAYTAWTEGDLRKRALEIAGTKSLT